MELEAGTLIPCSDLKPVKINGIFYMKVKNTIGVITEETMRGFDEEPDIIIEHEVITVNDDGVPTENEENLSQRDFFEGLEEISEHNVAVRNILNDSEGHIIDSEDECIEGTPRKRRRVEEANSGVKADLTGNTTEEKGSGIVVSTSDVSSTEQVAIDNSGGADASPVPDDSFDVSQIINNYLSDYDAISTQTGKLTIIKQNPTLFLSRVYTSQFRQLKKKRL